MCILSLLNTKIKLPFCKIDSEWAKRVRQMENLSNSIESYPMFGTQLSVSMVGGLLCI